MSLACPVILVPGITATSLRDEYALPAETLWSMSILSTTKEYERIALHPDDLRYETIEPARVVADQVLEVAYKELIEELRHNLSEDPERSVPVYAFAYDWRMPLEISEARLVRFMDEVIARTKLLRHYQNDPWIKNPRVNLVGHSMGGLLITDCLARYVEHFRERRDWRGLVDLLEFAYDNARSAELQRDYAVLAEAAGVVASPQIRNLGTLGGNICQDVWCWYLQDGFSCWKSGGKFCDLAGGDSRYYGSVMGGHLCLSNHPSDTAVALAALDARVHIVSPKGGREISISDFLCGHNWVGGRLQSHTLGLDEIVTEIEVPFRPTHSTYAKFALRKSWDFAIASVAVSAVIRDRVCEDLRIVLGGVATFPYRSHEAERLLRDREIDKASAGAGAEAALENARPLKMNGYKVELSKTLVRRALLSLGSVQ